MRTNCGKIGHKRIYINHEVGCGWCGGTGVSHVQFTVKEQPSFIIWITILQMFLASSIPEWGCPTNFSPRCSSIFSMLNLGRRYNFENSFLMSIQPRAYDGSVMLVRTHCGYRHDLMSHGLCTITELGNNVYIKTLPDTYLCKMFPLKTKSNPSYGVMP